MLRQGHKFCVVVIRLRLNAFLATNHFRNMNAQHKRRWGILRRGYNFANASPVSCCRDDPEQQRERER